MELDCRVSDSRSLALFVTAAESSAEPPPIAVGTWEACTFFTDPDLGYRGPAGVAIGSDGSVTVADYDHHEIRVYGLDRTFLRSWGSEGSEDGQFQSIGSIACDPLGHVIVSDLVGCRLQRFTLNGTLLNSWGECGSAPGQLGHLEAATVDVAGRVYVVDDALNRIVVFGPTGEWIREWSIGLGQASCIAVTPDTTILVASALSHTVHAYSPSGVLLSTWGTTGAGPGQFHGDIALATDVIGNVYVADEGNSRVQKFTVMGEWVSSWPAASPRALAVSLPIVRVLSRTCEIEDFIYQETEARRTSWGHVKAIYR